MATGEIVLGSFLAAFFQVLFDKLTSLALGYAQREGISTALLEEWKEMLVTINAVLADAEDRQLSDNPLVKLWLDDVRDLAYDMEDLLDEYEIEAVQAKSEAESSTSRGQVKRKFSFFGRPRSLVSETKVQGINGRLKTIVTSKASLSLRENVADRSNYTNKRDPTTSLPEPQFFGREKEEAQMLERLISEVENSNTSLSIVPIVGMGGVGKTALAQQLYNDARVYSCFETRAWVCVSDVFDVLDITKTILQSITGSSCAGGDLNSLQVKLKDNLSGKKFLVVLDDIWNEKYEKWTDLLKPFEVGARGSKIVITTRNLAVVSITGASPYTLKELSLDDCTSLLAFHALGAKNFESHPDFETIGKKIAERCKGLPLAAKMLGGVLRNKRNPDEWEDTLNNRIWDLPTAENDEVLPILKLSYVHLPWCLKRCFAYCAIFPKDYQIERDELFLDVRDTRNLKEMPLGISNLKNLTILSKFVVGTEKGSQLKELKNLPHLQGELIISELQNVEKVTNAADANLFGKLGLTNLSLQWKEHLGNLQNHECEAQVLDSLRPHTNLENLTISHYGGASFASWLGGSSYSKITSLCLRGCPNVTSLLSLGQLPSLKELSLEGLHAIRKIGFEFYGGKRPFSSLKILKFEEMLAWKEWSHYVKDPVVCLPSLRELYLEDCSKEILKSLVNLTSLTALKIENLTELVCFDPGFMRCLVKLKELHIGGCDKLNYLWQDGNETLNLICLERVIIKRCPQFTSFVVGEGEIELPCNIERMELRDCASLEKLPSKVHAIRDLRIENCPKVVGLTIPPDGPSSNNPMPHLEYLEINGCDSPTSFSFAEGTLAAPKTLYIRKCKGVESLPEEVTTVAESLESLTIMRCENLGSLPRCLHTLSHLTSLVIRGCPALEIEEDFPPLPITLSTLELINCAKIKSIASCNIASCKNLTRLEIRECPALEIEEDFLPLPITLSSLWLADCPKIKCLPNQWHYLTSLHTLWIFNCPNIECFPKGGFPPNLQNLEIRGCENVKRAVREWGLPLLTSLQSLSIDFGRSMGGGEGDNVCFPSSKEEEDAWSLLFPSSLNVLHLRNMRKVERLSSGLRNHLSSLTHLRISDCPKLRYLPEDGLPPSLQHLWIRGSKNLEEGCSKPPGHYWPLIQHIPEIYIDADRIQ
ncbi:putative disease resistance RPP13-like protein 1 [Rhodamnia argentea]|uniref:Disease resistance RPP13-like protein 1 n=1 Tax=Rhodamnia argentea TaxID=178133 RepID=A0ABM3HHL4_9MYRT|nr:putative disease resistance RPP13-like protein 1 [Rhodamnia argentea]